MKRLIKWIIILFILLVAVLIAAPFFIPLDSVKKLASDKVREMTGRELVIGGDIKASMWPNIGVKLGQVTLSNPEGYSDKYMAEIGELTAEVALMPLLNGEVQIKQFTINKPTIHLEINKNNVGNWEFGKKEKPAATNAENNTAPAAKKPAGEIPALGKIKITGGDFTYRDTRTGKIYNASDVNLDVNMPDLESPLDVSAKLNLNKEQVDIVLNAKEPWKLSQENGDSPIKAEVKIGSLLALKFEGKGNIQGANGNLDLNIPSLVALSGWSSKKIDWKGDTKLALNVNGAANCTTSQCVLSKAKITFDDAVLTGDIKANLAGAVPSIEGKLASDKINLNHYMPKPDKQAAASFISHAHAADAAGWDTKPIDLSGLKAANANLTLDVKEMLYQATTISKIQLVIKLANGALALDIPHAEFYNGSAKLVATATAGGAISANFAASNIQIEPLLKDFAGSDRLTGTANLSTNITARGTSQRDIVASLNGKGELKVSDGMIRGVNIAQVISNAKAMVTGVDTSSDKTQFSELGGTYIITQGIVKNDDLVMKAPLLRLKGAGTVDLPNRYVKYLLTPTVVASLKGQGGKDKTGLDIPVMVEGNFEKLKFTPDLASIANEALKDPEKIKDTVKSIKESVKKPEDIKNLLKGFR
jgi:AsmA protein